MRIIDFIFVLLLKFSRMSREQYAELYGEAELWYSKIRTDDNIPEGEKQPNPVLVKFKKIAETWQFRLFLAIAYVPAVRGLLDYMKGAPDDPQEDDNKAPW